MKIKGVWWASISVLTLSMLGMYSGVGVAETPLQSPNYRFEESVLGGGGLVQSNSANFQASGSFGETAAGGPAATSPNFQVQPGNTTTKDPTLSFTINNANASFGAFSAAPGGTATATSTFSVSNYTSFGYAVQIIGTPPTNGGKVLPGINPDPPETTAPSQYGQEEFGINLAANSEPRSFGANPDHGQFGFGSAAPNYATGNRFRYVSGETIAIGPKTSGETTYTISYIANVAALTPGGQYSSNQTLICTGTF
jgi:hypothetical protein